MAIPTENEGDEETRRTKGRGERSRRRGGRAFLRDRIGFAMFSAGSTLGLRAPDCAKEPLALWTLFIGVVAWVHITIGSRVRFTRRFNSELIL